MSPPRPQPYGIATGRGAFERSQGSRWYRRPLPDGLVPPVFLFANQATTPPSEADSQSGTTVVIPVDSGEQPGDRLYALIRWAATGVTPPAGWTLLASDSPRFFLYRYIVQAGDPSSWTWNLSGSGFSRSGVIIGIRGGVEGDLSAIANSFNVPSVDVSTQGAIVVSCCTENSLATTSPVESMVANAPLVLRAQHVGDGSASYQVPLHTGVATESPSPGTISGRSFGDTAAGTAPRTLALVLEAA